MTERLLQFQSFDHFRELVKSYLDINAWGVGGAKSVDELWTELLNKDSGLICAQNGILRLTWPIFVDVKYQNGERVYQCYESESKKGVVRDLPGTFAEKRHADETLESAMQRIFIEEIEPSFSMSALSLIGHNIRLIREWTENTGARSYPALPTLSTNCLYDLWLAPNQGVPQPFKLVEANGKSFFDWRALS